jgi:hypothetical protein
VYPSLHFTVIVSPVVPVILSAAALFELTMLPDGAQTLGVQVIVL